MKPRFGRRWRGSEAGRHEGGKYLAGTSRKGKATSGLEPLSCSLRVNCSYWTNLCFTLLDNRRYQRERRSVRRCNERLAVSSAPIPCEGLASLYVLPANLMKEVPDEGTRTADLLQLRVCVRAF